MKKMIFATLVAVMGLYSCSKTELANTSNPLPMPENVAAKVQGLEITPKTNYVVVGEGVTLTASFKPEDAQAGTVTWKSSDETVATVDAGGKVTTLAKGVASITASVDGVSASALVNVFAERVPATEIQLSKTEVSLLVGRAANIKSALLPENTTDARKLEWTSSDEKVAVVSYGYIQAVGMGEATITASQDGLTATVKVTVADKIKLVDRKDTWTVTDTPKWDKNWQGNITGSHEEVSVSGFDGEYAYFGIVEASKFEGVEAVSNAVYEQVTEKQDAGQSPEGLFRKGEEFSANYSEKGEAVAYLLAYDEEFEFTGEYVVYNFTGREPDPVPATGIMVYTQSYDYSTWSYVKTEIKKIEIKEGKRFTGINVGLLPEDCTDLVSEIVLSSDDESVCKIGSNYNGYYVEGVAAGEAHLVARLSKRNLEVKIPVTVTGGSVVWTDMSSVWKGHFGDVIEWGSTYFGFVLDECDSPKFYIFTAKASDVGDDLVAYMKSTAASNEEWLSYYAKNELPAQESIWSGGPDDEYYAFAVGVDASGSAFDGKYAIFHHDPNAGSGGQGGDPVEGKMISMSGNYFSVTWEDEYKSLDEVTMEGWVYGDSFTGNASGNDGLASMMGIEGVFLIRLQNGKPEVVYGGAKKANGEYEEKKVTCTTTLADKEWHHLAATYVRSGNVILYIDGVEAGRNTAEDHGIDMNGVGAGWAGGGLADWHFYIGVSCQTSRDFDGSLAYLRVWDSARSASEISDNMSKAEPVDNGYNLLANWYFNEGTGNKVADQSGYGYDITANSDVTWVEGTLPF